MKRDSNPCVDCGVATTPYTKWGTISPDDRWEYYMVWDYVWEATGVGTGHLCVGCLEERLGRRLTPEDFIDYPINWLFPDTDRLAERKQP